MKIPDRIEKSVTLKVSASRVWKALTDHKEFSAWFGVKLEKPFRTGRYTSGNITYPGYEHLVMKVKVKAMKPESYFAFEWHPYAVDPKVDYSKEAPTLVEFTLEETKAGTRLTVVESGFSRVPAARRAEAFRMNSGGWTEQMKNIRNHVAKT